VTAGARRNQPVSCGDTPGESVAAVEPRDHLPGRLPPRLKRVSPTAWCQLPRGFRRRRR
jgi:hypothetical protein